MGFEDEVSLLTSAATEIDLGRSQKYSPRYALGRQMRSEREIHPVSGREEAAFDVAAAGDHRHRFQYRRAFHGGAIAGVGTAEGPVGVARDGVSDAAVADG